MLAVPRWASKVMLCWMGSIVADLSASIAFYRRRGVEIPDAGVWRTPTGGHHASAADQLWPLRMSSRTPAASRRA